MTPSLADEADLHHHGDADALPGLIDLAVNVRPCPPPWLAEALGTPATWVAYPDPAEARAKLAAWHGVDEACVLPTAGAASAFTLVARALATERATVLHPQFTEPEAALRRAGRPVRRLALRPPFTLDAAQVPADSDLVVVGNPTNPTGVLHPRAEITRLRAPQRVLVVDEAFMDFAGDAETALAPGGDLTGVLVVRSLTKLWGLAGVRSGYVVGDPALVARLANQQVPWEVSTPALRAMTACATPQAAAEAARIVAQVDADRAALSAALAAAGFPHYPVPPARAGAPFVLVDTASVGPGSVREPLASLGFAVRRGETFPGLGPSWIRVAVPDPATGHAFVAALASLRQR